MWPLPEYAQKRLEICNACELFRHTTKTCGSCGCFMPAKTVMKTADCPENKWEKVAT